MVLKRFSREGGDDGSEFPAREPKRQHPFSGCIAWDLIRGPPQEYAKKLESCLRKVVREEVESAFSSISITLQEQVGSSGSSAWQLHFDNDNIPDTLFTGSKVESEDNKPVKIVLCDANSKKIVASGPLSSLKIAIVVLDGDFSPDLRDDWTEQEFNARILEQREGKRPLVTGDLVVQLRDGEGYVGNICFTDNSSWIRGRKFRLGVKVHTASAGVRIREGVSKKFTVKDHRGESYKKHYPPSADDEVWRLEKIAKDGASHLRLTSNGISTVKELLRWLVTKPDFLRSIIGGNLSDKKWKAITKHAKTCNFDNKELYVYRAAEDISLVFNAIFKVVGAIVDGLNYRSLDKLNVHHKKIVEKLKHRAYENIQDLVPFDDPSSICSTSQLSSPQATSFGSSALDLLHLNCPVEQADQVELPMTSDHATISPTYTSELEDHSQLDVTMAERSSRRMLEHSPAFRNSFSFADAYQGIYSERQSWDATGPMGMEPLMLPEEALTENYQFASWMQGTGQFTAPLDEPRSHLASSSDLEIQIPKNIKPNARWVKIRAVIKWRILFRQKSSLRELQDLFLNLS